MEAAVVEFEAAGFTPEELGELVEIASQYMPPLSWPGSTLHEAEVKDRERIAAARKRLNAYPACKKLWMKERDRRYGL